MMSVKISRKSQSSRWCYDEGSRQKDRWDLRVNKAGSNSSQERWNSKQNLFAMMSRRIKKEAQHELLPDIRTSNNR